jgi:hypothetical protein
MRAAILALALLVVGCGLEFVNPADAPAPPAPAYLRIVIVADGFGDSLAIEALLDPGRDSVGIRPILSDVLLIGTDVIPADSIPGSPIRRYRRSSSLAAAPPVLEITGPMLDGTSPAYQAVRMPLVIRGGAREIMLDRGTDLDNPLRVGSADPSAGVNPMSWSFRLQADTGVAVVMGGVGTPPPVLALPAGVLALVSGDSCMAYLDAVFSASVGLSRDAPLESNAYVLTASAFTRLDWIVRLTNPTP